MAKVLLIDDEREVLELLRFVLEREGHDILEAIDGNEGLNCVQKEKPDLIILDIMMPEMDGQTLNARLTAHEDTRKIPVIILTARGHMRDFFVTSPNVAFYMEKPFDANELRDNIRQALSA